MKEHVPAAFVDSVAQHRHNLQAFSVNTPSCVYNGKKTENPTACDMRSVIRFLNVKKVKLAEIHHQLCDLYGEHAMSSSVARRWVQLFNEGRKYLHYDLWSGRLSVVSEDLVRAVEEMIREKR